MMWSYICASCIATTSPCGRIINAFEHLFPVILGIYDSFRSVHLTWNGSTIHVPVITKCQRLNILIRSNCRANVLPGICESMNVQIYYWERTFLNFFLRKGNSLMHDTILKCHSFLSRVTHKEVDKHVRWQQIHTSLRSPVCPLGINPLWACFFLWLSANLHSNGWEGAGGEAQSNSISALSHQSSAPLQFSSEGARTERWNLFLPRAPEEILMNFPLKWEMTALHCSVVSILTSGENQIKQTIFSEENGSGNLRRQAPSHGWA